MAVVFMAALAGCGGRAGGGAVETAVAGVSVPPATVPSPSPGYQPLVSRVAEPAYAVAEEAALVRLINTLRRQVGVGLLEQSRALDEAASRHADYLVINRLLTDTGYLLARFDAVPGVSAGTLGGHYQEQARPGFTGKTPSLRALAAGYVGSAEESLVVGVGSSSGCLASLQNSVYHLAELLSPALDIGVRLHPGNGQGPVCVVLFGTSASTRGQLPAEGSPAIYPYPQQVQVAPTFYNRAEAPDPAPDLPMTGPPVLASLRTLAVPEPLATDIVIDTFSVAAEGAVLPARVLASPNVRSTGPILAPDTHLASPAHVVLLPLQPSKPQVVLTATLKARVRGQVIERSWQFTTGDGSPAGP